MLTESTFVNAAQFLLENIILKHGMVREVLTYRGILFLRSVMKETFALLNVKHLLTSPYHPQRMDGQAKRCIKTFLTILSHFLHHNQKNWDVIVLSVEWCRNTMHEKTAGFTPLELVHGRTPLNPNDISLEYIGLIEVKTASAHLNHIKEWFSIAHRITLSKLK